ncbi:MAG: hypothetical protein AUI36_13920, partial [Cyanobacteria bacterium 13_1_40CM_2_61_4]
MTLALPFRSPAPARARAWSVAATLLCLALGSAPAHAQFSAATVDSLAAAIERFYVFPEVANRTAAALRAKLRKGGYAGLDSAKALADSLTSDLHAIGKDRHFRVGYWHRELPADAFTEHGPSPEERERAALQARRLNHGFERVQRLMGNVGYLDLRAFDGTPEAGALAMAAMTLLGGSDALIIDLRRNGGGDPNMIVLLLSWLFPADDRVHVNDFYLRKGDRTEQYYTLTTIPGPRYVDKEVYVLTSRRTGSAAEEFAYDIKNLKRGTLIGETTWGGANPGEIVRLGPHFAAFISDGRAINPISKTNWEGVGVEPDVKTSADDALKTAHVAALTKLIAKETDTDR